jgi:hypothetical protein
MRHTFCKSSGDTFNNMSIFNSAGSPLNGGSLGDLGDLGDFGDVGDLGDLGDLEDRDLEALDLVLSDLDVRDFDSFFDKPAPGILAERRQRGNSPTR